MFATLGFVSPIGATATQATLDDIAEELETTGRYVEFTLSADEEAAIDRANDRGVAFTWLSSSDEAEPLADLLSATLDQTGSRYRTVLVLTDSGLAAWSESVALADIDDALDASFDDFRNGAVGNGIDAFVTTLSVQTTTAATTAPSATSGSDGGAIGLGSILLIGAVVGGGFLLFRSIRKRSKAKKEAAADLEADRAEIKEQLKDNADHVLTLGDRVIASGNAELMATYEQASAAYQDVSHSIDGATTAVEIDELDDKIDHAEWQLLSIKARLEGRPVPPSPAEVEAQAEAARPKPVPTPPSHPNQERSRVGPDDPVLSHRPAPRSRSRYQPQPRGRQGGLGGVLGGIILGGGVGGGSRRTQRRRTSSGVTSGRSRRSVDGGLGGGVLRRGRSSSRSRSSGGSSRSFGRSKRGGSSRSFGRLKRGGSSRDF